MFRKIVTELAFSPTLVGNLGYYIKTLRNEASKRQIGLIFTLLTVMVQLITVLAPPESANSNNPEIFTETGVESPEQYLEYFDQNTANIRDLFTSLGITRSEVEAAKQEKLLPTHNAVFWSLNNTRTEENTAYSFRNSRGETSTAFYQPISPNLYGSSVYTGSSSRLGGNFSVTKAGANLITDITPPSNCSVWLKSPTTPLEVDTWTKDDRCLSVVALSLTARKISSNTPGADQLSALDRVAYTISVKNMSEKTVPLIPSINLEDILEYSRILDYGGGEYDFNTKNLTWNATDLAPENNLGRTFIVQLLPTIPATAKGQYITASYDCQMTASFGNSIKASVDCPVMKQVEKITSSLPYVPPSITITSGVVLLAVVSFLYARSRQQLSEIYIIRHNHLGGL